MKKFVVLAALFSGVVSSQGALAKTLEDVLKEKVGDYGGRWSAHL